MPQALQILKVKPTFERPPLIAESMPHCNGGFPVFIFFGFSNAVTINC
jgi:hypothetical protein